MTKKQKFINFIKENAEIFDKAEDPEIVEYWESFSTAVEVEKPAFTDNGKLIIQFFQNSATNDFGSGNEWIAKDIAEQIGLTSRSVTGAMRKLINDGYIEKIAGEPTKYVMTEKGAAANLEA